MADPRYAIDWAPPDIGPGAAFISSVLNQNRTQARADEHLRIQQEHLRRGAERESHEMKRHADELAYRRSVEAYQALPTLMRAAHRSPEMANANPYGIKFDKQTPPPPSIANVDIMGSGGNAYGQHAAQALAAPLPQTTLEQGQEGPEQDPAAEAMRFPADALETPEEPSPGISAAEALLGQQPKPKLFASMGGNRFELPEQSDTSGFGPKYDAIYQRALQEPGITPEEAFQMVQKMAHDDATEAGRNQRSIDAEAGRDRRFDGYHMDVNQQFDKLRMQLAQSDINSRRAAAAGGIGPTRSPALQEFVAAANALNPGEPIPPQVADLGLRAGFKPNQIAAEADRYRNSDTKSLKGGSGVLGLKEVAPLNTSIDNIDKLIGQIESNPRAWDEYKDNSLTWKRGEGARGTTVGKGLQAFGLMNVAPEQGLKSPEAKTLHQRQERLNTDIAKSFGGVITEGDRNAAASNQANFALDAQQKIAQLREMRDSLVSKRNVFLQSNAQGSQPAGTRSVRMPDGSIQKFDATGKRVE